MIDPGVWLSAVYILVVAGWLLWCGWPPREEERR